VQFKSSYYSDTYVQKNNQQRTTPVIFHVAKATDASLLDGCVEAVKALGC
jgi:hypothetical protein